jgi:hypothetical protein
MDRSHLAAGHIGARREKSPPRDDRLNFRDELAERYYGAVGEVKGERSL